MREQAGCVHAIPHARSLTPGRKKEASMSSSKIVRFTALAAAAVAVTALGGSKSNAETVYSLTTAGSSATIGGALFETNQVQPTGSGLIHSFVRIQTNNAIERGYNTDARPLQFDENNSATFTRSLPVAD